MSPWIPLLVCFVLCCVTIGVLIWVWFVRAQDVVQHKAEEYVTDEMLAAKSRAETRIDNLSDLEKARRIDDEFGGPK